jgi:hypothetical protein
MPLPSTPHRGLLLAEGPYGLARAVGSLAPHTLAHTSWNTIRRSVCLRYASADAAAPADIYGLTGLGDNLCFIFPSTP